MALSTHPISWVSLSGLGVQNPRPREISWASGDVFPNTSLLLAVYGYNMHFITVWTLNCRHISHSIPSTPAVFTSQCVSSFALKIFCINSLSSSSSRQIRVKTTEIYLYFVTGAVTDAPCVEYGKYVASTLHQTVAYSTTLETNSLLKWFVLRLPSVTNWWEL